MVSPHSAILCFSNILIDDNFDVNNIEDHLYFIDPRGMIPNKSKEITSVGDYKYDIGKLAHSIIGNYDLIKANIIKADKVGERSFTLYDETTQYKNIVKDHFFEIAGKKLPKQIKGGTVLFDTNFKLHPKR